MRIVYFLFVMTLSLIISEIRALEIEQFFMPGELIFDHEELETTCTNCHVRGRDTTQKKLCLDCHDHEPIADDIRNKRGFHGKDKNARKLDCKSCHSDHKGREARVVWLDKDKFDHRFTDFRLEGKHQLTECSACHEKESKYREAKNGCYDCHSEDDAHKGDLGKKCSDCHVPAGWYKSEFDHDKTDFKLKFAHRQTACSACHIKGKYKDTPKQCASCHAIRDVHGNRFGKKCQSCHQEKGWDKSIFEHDRDTKYKLRGKHLKQSCNDCHSIDYKVSKKAKKPRECYSCHRGDDAHNELNGKQCQDCHVARGWKHADFDHSENTEFELNGAHKDLVCEACHVTGAETKEIDTACYSCHKLDDVHKREQGEECEQCHKEVSWQHQVRFDHELTEFPLIGQHAASGCEACHATSVFGDAGNLCIDCHSADDVHKRGLGDDCADCHNSNAWLIWNFDHDETTFKLRDSHSDLHCHQCHNNPLETQDGRDWQCADCHRRSDIHDGKFGDTCDKCHNQKNFDTISIQSISRYKRPVTEDARE